ncbi:MAG TPA: cytochrome c [Candidatus Polarisedimenticolia bacterium]|nr:cytochrome c [Candidatus Polarisedimenticolia bacterium]
MRDASHSREEIGRNQNVQRGPSNKDSRWFGIVALFVVLGLVGIAASYSVRNWGLMAKARKLKNPVPSSDEAIAAGRQIYTKHCEKCHGVNGDGKGPKAADLSVAPGDFTDAHKMRTLVDGELYWQITYGRLPMPAFADKMSDEERWQLVDYIRTFSQNVQRPSPAAPATLRP